MSEPRLSLYTQTPYLRLLREDVPPGSDVEALREGIDHLPSPGGVTRMMRTLLGELLAQRRIRNAAWTSLTNGPPTPLRLHDAVALHHVRLEGEELAAYTRAKAAVWEQVHGLREERATEEELAGLGALSRAMARSPAADTADVHYVHDFQLLPLADHLPPGAPRIFRWHIPVAGLEGALREHVVRCLDRYDAVIVSTQGYARALRDAGVRVPIHARYPYLDGSRRVVTSEEIAAFDARWGLAPGDVPFVVVARMDPMKRQDVAIRALARAPPQARLLLVGGGGFSSGRAGLGMDYAGRWRAELEALANELGVADRVTFTGGVSDEELELAYARARAVILPSTLEGFGLAAVEGWLHSRPALVSRGCGVAELVIDDHNGFTFEPGDDATLGRAMTALSEDAAKASVLGENGRATARVCHVSHAVDGVWEILSAKTPAGPRRLP